MRAVAFRYKQLGMSAQEMLDNLELLRKEVDSEEDGHYYGFYRVEEDGATRLGKYTAANVVLYINDDGNLAAVKNDNGTYYSGAVSATDSGISMTWVPEDDDVLSAVSNQILTFTDKYDLSLISAFA